MKCEKFFGFVEQVFLSRGSDRLASNWWLLRFVSGEFRLTE